MPIPIFGPAIKTIKGFKDQKKLKKAEAQLEDKLGKPIVDLVAYYQRDKARVLLEVIELEDMRDQSASKDQIDQKQRSVIQLMEDYKNLNEQELLETNANKMDIVGLGLSLQKTNYRIDQELEKIKTGSQSLVAFQKGLLKDQLEFVQKIDQTLSSVSDQLISLQQDVRTMNGQLQQLENRLEAARQIGLFTRLRQLIRNMFKTKN
ncbi:MAG: hypothetical protein F6K19_30890 [Cyanothece sp. SIO1E1]|nr:hypothetical protein [Cyanothece sp. SIO1E1]